MKRIFQAEGPEESHNEDQSQAGSSAARRAEQETSNGSWQPSRTARPYSSAPSAPRTRPQARDVCSCKCMCACVCACDCACACAYVWGRLLEASCAPASCPALCSSLKAG